MKKVEDIKDITGGYYLDEEETLKVIGKKISVDEVDNYVGKNVICRLHDISGHGSHRFTLKGVNRFGELSTYILSDDLDEYELPNNVASLYECLA